MLTMASDAWSKARSTLSSSSRRSRTETDVEAQSLSSWSQLDETVNEDSFSERTAATTEIGDGYQHGLAEMMQLITEQVEKCQRENEKEILESGTVPTRTFEDIAGLEKLKCALYETLIIPLLQPNFNAAIIDKSQKTHFGYESVLFYGPPGTGKTYISQAISNKLNAK